MCGIWTMEEWQAAVSKENSPYKLTGEFIDGKGKKAIQIAEGAEADFVWNVYSENGKDNGLFFTSPSHGSAIEQANKEMTRRGFRVVGKTEAPEQAAAEITPLPTPDADGVLRVDGKTLDEWEQVGYENEDRPINEHVHPRAPIGRLSTEVEMRAFVASMSPSEALFALFDGLMSGSVMNETETVSA